MSKHKSKASIAKNGPQESFSEDGSMSFTPEQRYQMIAEAAYYRAEKRGFDGANVEQDWREAEAEIDRILQ